MYLKKKNIAKYVAASLMFILCGLMTLLRISGTRNSATSSKPGSLSQEFRNWPCMDECFKNMMHRLCEEKLSKILLQVFANLLINTSGFTKNNCPGANNVETRVLRKKIPKETYGLKNCLK